MRLSSAYQLIPILPLKKNFLYLCFCVENLHMLNLIWKKIRFNALGFSSKRELGLMLYIFLKCYFYYSLYWGIINALIHILRSIQTFSPTPCLQHTIKVLHILFLASMNVLAILTSVYIHIFHEYFNALYQYSHMSIFVVLILSF